MKPYEKSSEDRDRVISHVRRLRLARGLAQKELAARIGVTRQALSAIESGHSVPSTLVGLRLARTLDCRVEDLFRLPEDPATDVVWVPDPPRIGDRIAAASLRGRTCAHRLHAGRTLQTSIVEGNALVRFDPAKSINLGTSTGTRSSPPMEWLAHPEHIERTVLMMGCDPALGLLKSLVNRREEDLDLIWLPGDSATALAQVRAGTLHIAGTHLPDAEGGDFNTCAAREALAETGGILINLTTWDQGLLVDRGNPHRIEGVEDLANPSVRLANRELGSGSRAVLDGLLAAAGIRAESIRGYETCGLSHLNVAQAVADGNADAAVGLPLTAYELDLGFVPQVRARFDLVVPADLIELEPVARVLEVIASGAFRRRLETLPGYSTRSTGDVVLRVEPRRAPDR